MTTKHIAVCERCGEEAENPCHFEDNDALPEGWDWISLHDQPGNWDICPVCTEKLIEWFNECN